MTEALLVLQAAIWLMLCLAFISSRSASVFHPFAFYLAFHGIVFVIRPILEHAFNLEHVFYLMRFYPTDEVIQLTLVLTTVALLVFAAMSWALEPSAPRFDRRIPAGFAPAEWYAFIAVCALLLPVALYSLSATLQSAMPSASGDAVFEQDQDPNTGIVVFTNTTGYIADAQKFLGALSLMLIWGARFRLWSFAPLALYFAERAYIGWSRWTIVLTLISLALLFLLQRRRRWFSVRIAVLAIPFFLLFQQLGENRDYLKNLIAGEDVQEDVLLANRTWIERQDSPDFANFDFLTYVIDAVPEKSGTYTYFTQYLQLFTEPIPRILWPDKPVGAPIQLVQLNDFGNFISWTASIVGDGWMSGGWLGLVVTMSLVGFATARLHRWFWRGDASNFKILAYCIFIPLTLQWYRDGGMQIAKFAFLTIFPVILWRLILKLLSARTAQRRYEPLVSQAVAPPANRS